MARLGLKTLCLYCGFPMGQGEHDHCLKRIRKLQFLEKADQKEMIRQLAYLKGRYKKLHPHACPRCGATCRWRSVECHAHTREWVAYYGGHISGKPLVARKTAIHRYGVAARQGVFDVSD